MKTKGRVFPVLAVVLCLMMITFGVASAVTNGQPDGDNHPYVGLVVFSDAAGTPLWRCSGSLIAPTVFLTAAHCTDGAAGARVYFDSTVDATTGYPREGGVTGMPYTNPDFCNPCANGLPGFSSHDVGIVVLESPVEDQGFAALPAENLVSTLAMKTGVDLVGYGVQFKEGTGVPPFNRWTGPRTRMYAPSQFVASKDVISAEYIKLTANPAQGKGGTCFGDSGGADFLGDTNTVLGVNSFVTNANCTGVTYSTRVDTPDILSWIQSFLD